jgi:hypothetical protein
MLDHPRGGPGETELTQEIVNFMTRGTELRRKNERCLRCGSGLIYRGLQRRGRPANYAFQLIYVGCEDCEFWVTEPIRFIKARLQAEALLDAIRVGTIAELVVALRHHPAWRGFVTETEFYQTIIDRLDKLQADGRIKLLIMRAR